MKRETIVKEISEIIFSENDPYTIVEDMASYIEERYKPKKDNTTERWKVDTTKWIDDWISLFPVGVRSGGKLLRSDKKICIDKMAKFRIAYNKYDLDTIFNATSEYLNRKAQDDYAYTSCAVNFISHRDKGSELAAECENFINKSESSVKAPDFKDYFV